MVSVCYTYSIHFHLHVLFLDQIYDLLIPAFLFFFFFCRFSLYVRTSAHTLAVPRMHLNSLAIGCSPVVGTGMSLSAAICREGSIIRDDVDCDDSDGDHSYTELYDETAISTSTNTNCPTLPYNNDLPTTDLPCREVSIHCVDGTSDVDSTSCKVLTWRDQSLQQQSVQEPVKILDVHAFSNRIDLHSCSGGVVTTTTDTIDRQESLALVSSNCSTSSKYVRSMKSASYSTLRGEDSARNAEDIKGTARSCYLNGTGYDEETLAILMRTFNIISASLLQRCVVGEGNFLDIGTCSTHETDSSSSLLAKRRYSDWGTDDGVLSPTSTSLKSQSLVGQLALPDDRTAVIDSKPLKRTKPQKRQINILFSIREYLESIPDSEQYHITPILTEISNFSLGASMRVLKLISPNMLHSCLPSHMNEAEKVGSGGFGSVFKVCCDASCKDHRTILSTHSTQCQLHTSKSNSGRRSAFIGSISSTIKSTNSVSIRNDNGSTSSRTIYAVKRIPRERSVYDSPIIYDIFSEITSLEFLAGNKGVSTLLACSFKCQLLFCISVSLLGYFLFYPSSNNQSIRLSVCLLDPNFIL